MRKNKSITFDKDAQDKLPEHIKQKMKKDRENAKKMHPEEVKEWAAMKSKPSE